MKIANISSFIQVYQLPGTNTGSWDYSSEQNQVPDHEAHPLVDRIGKLENMRFTVNITLNY